MSDVRDKELTNWQDRIKDGQRFQLKIARSTEWNKYKAYYRHEFQENQVPVNLMYSVCRSLVPQTYFRNPKVTVTPRRPGIEAELMARLVQKIDNWLLYELMTKREMKKMITDTFFCGIASGFHGYDSQYGLDPSRMIGGMYSMTQFDAKGNRIETNKNVQPGMPWFLRARPEDVVYPWGCSDPESAEWVALRVFRQVRDIMADKKYSNKAGISGTVVPNRTSPEGGMVEPLPQAGVGAVNPDEQWVELWQVHDGRTGKVLALTMDHPSLLRKEVDEMQIEGLPVETLVFNNDPDFIYGIPDARIIEPQLRELIEIRTQARKHRRIDILKGLVKKGTISPEELQKLTSADVMAFAQVDTEGSIKDSVATMSPGASGILQDLTLAGDIVRGDIREMVGMSRVGSGEYQGKTHISSEETKKVFQSMNIRLDERRDAVADMLTGIVRKWNQQIFTRWTGERIEQIVGPDGARWWLSFTGPQIKDEYDLMIEPEEGPPMDSQSKREMILSTAEVWSKLNAGAIAQGAPVPAEIQRALFAQFDELGIDVDRLIAQAQVTSQAAQQMIAAGTGQTPGKAASISDVAGAYQR